MAKSKQCEQVIKQITEAFADTPRPKNDNFGYDWDDPEDDNMQVDFSKFKHWRDITFDLLFKHQNYIMCLTDEGFRYMLPAFMTFIVIKGYEAKSELIRHLTHPKFLHPNSYTSQEQKKFEKRVYSFSKE